ncbi:putative ankyrin 2,3/unc44 [Metarhizium anisopliae]
MTANSASPLKRLIGNLYQTIDGINEADESGETALSWAIRRGQPAIAQLLLSQRNINVNYRNKGRQTPLMLAAHFGSISLVRGLLAWRNIKLNARDERGQSALFYAAAKGHSAIVARLLASPAALDLNNKNCYGETPIIAAASSGSPDTVRLLLAQPGLELDFVHDRFTPLTAAAKTGDADVFDVFLALAMVEPTLLSASSAHQTLESLQANLPADINLSTPLHNAAEGGHLAIVWRIPSPRLYLKR